MDKKQAFQLLGVASPAEAARALGITPSAVSQWPNRGDIPQASENRVLAELAKRQLGKTIDRVVLAAVNRSAAARTRSPAAPVRRRVAARTA